MNHLSSTSPQELQANSSLRHRGRALLCTLGISAALSSQAFANEVQSVFEERGDEDWAQVQRINDDTLGAQDSKGNPLAALALIGGLFAFQAWLNSQTQGTKKIETN